MRRFLIATLICLVFAVPAIGQELTIPNASFEKAGEGGLPEGWGLITTEGQGKIALDKEAAHSGKSSLLLSGVELKDRAGVVLYWKPSGKKPLKDKSFKASIWYRTEKLEGTTIFKVEGINEKRNNIPESYNTAIPNGTTDEWKKAELKFKITSEETVELWINLYLQGGSGKIWFDDLQLEIDE